MSEVTLELTDGERLLIARRRKGLTQGEMAEELNVKTCTYASYEKDEDRKFRHGPPLPLPEVGPIQHHETIVILRTRRGLTLTEAAAVVGTSRATYANIEGGGRVAMKWGEYAINQLRQQT